MDVADTPWLLLTFRLPARQASQRVEAWRKLRQHGALAMPSSGHLLPNSPQNRERFEWIAAAVRKSKGDASVIEVRSIDASSPEALKKMFQDARAGDYNELLRQIRKLPANGKSGAITRLRRRLQEIEAIDFFGSPLRSRVEAALAQAERRPSTDAGGSAQKTKDYRGRIWITRPRPGIDRVSSAWLIRRFIDPKARFIFDADPRKHPDALPFDMFHGAGFGHRGDDCTFETLVKDFRIRDQRVSAIAGMIHDADLEDGKFARVEALGIDRVLIGWAQQGVPDEELLRRGMELIEGLYQSLS